MPLVVLLTAVLAAAATPSYLGPGWVTLAAVGLYAAATVTALPVRIPDPPRSAIGRLTAELLLAVRLVARRAPWPSSWSPAARPCWRRWRR